MRARSAEARISLRLAVPFIVGVIQGPMPPSTDNLESLGEYAAVADELLNAYATDQLHPAALRKWAELEPELNANAPELWRAVQTRLNGHASVNGNGQAGSPLVLRKLSDLLAEPEEAVDWLVDGLLPSGGFSLLAAKPKVGKSTLPICLALAAARGEVFLGRATAKGPVIYLALEEKRSEVRKHFHAMGQPARKRFISTRQPPRWTRWRKSEPLSKRKSRRY